MVKSEIKDFTKGNITKQLIIFALPILLSNLLQIVYNMVDMIIVGNVLGKTGVSSVSVGGDITNFLTFVAMGFASAGQVIIAKYVGGGEKSKIGKFVGTMSAFLFICSVVLTALGLIFQNGLLKLMSTPEDAFEGAKSYSLISISGLVFICGYNVVSAILRGMGDSKHPLLFIAIAATLNIVLDLIFVIPLGMGAGGAALATVISQAVSFISCTIFLVIKRRAFELNVKGRNFIVMDKEMLSRLLKLGVPMSIKFAAVHVSKLFVNSWVNGYGIAVSAFAGIVNKIASVSNLISNSMNTAGSTLVGQNLEACKYDRVKGILKSIMLITMIVAVVLSLIMIFFNKQVIGLFTDNNDVDVLDLAPKFVPIAIILFFGSGLRATMNALMNGSGNTAVNFATAILDGIVLRIGLSVLFGLAFGMEHYGFWLGDAIAGLTPFWIGLVFYFTGKWKKTKKITNTENNK